MHPIVAKSGTRACGTILVDSFLAVLAMVYYCILPPWEPKFPSLIWGYFTHILGVLNLHFFHGLLGSKGWNWHFAPDVTGGTTRSERFKPCQASTFRGVSNVCFRCRVELIEIVIYCPPWKISNIYLLMNYTCLWFIVISRFSIGSPVNQSRPNKWNGWLRWSIEPGFPLARLPTRSLVGCSGRTWDINTRWKIPHRTDTNWEVLEL